MTEDRDMDAYWILEYVKVLAGYTFLMFLWPSVVFGEYLKGKSKRDIFSFCVTVQIVIINTVVLMLGLFGILHIRLVAILFYGIFLAAVLRKGWFQRLLAGKDKIKLQGIPKVKGEWILLMAVVGFGTLYFSYGSFQIHSYGVYDVFLHHGWVNKLAEGKIFPNGIYPEGMHCFIYCLYALFGIRIYSSMLYLQSIHIAVFFSVSLCFASGSLSLALFADFCTLSLCGPGYFWGTLYVPASTDTAHGVWPAHTVSVRGVFCPLYEKNRA